MKIKIYSKHIEIPLIGELKISSKISHGKRQLIDLDLPGSDWIWLRCYSPNPDVILTTEHPIDLHIEIDDQHWHTTIYQAKLVDDGSECNLEIECRWEGQARWQNQRTGIFYGCHLKDVVKHQLTDFYRYTALHNHCDDNPSRYPWHPSLTQWQESDGSFLDRQLMRHGAWHYLHHTESGVEFRLGDMNAMFEPAVKVDAFENQLQNTESVGIFNVLPKSTCSLNNPAEIRFWQFNEDDPQHPFSHTESIDSHFLESQIEMRSPFVELNEAQLKAVTKNAADSFRVRQETLSGQFRAVDLRVGLRMNLSYQPSHSSSRGSSHSSSRGFTAGSSLFSDLLDPAVKPRDNDAMQTSSSLAEEDRGSLSAAKLLPQMEGHAGSSHLVTETLHHYTHRAHEQYSENHHFIAHPLTVPYRPLYDPREDWQTQPRHAGHVSEITTYLEDKTLNHAIPDQTGCVPLQFPYDFSVNGTEECRYTRRCDIVNASVANSSFPLYRDSECVVMFVQGNPDRPVFIGCIANEQTGHLHSTERQQRSDMALLEGQYLMHSNHEKQNTLTFGMKYENHDSFIQMNSKPDSNGELLDTLWQTNSDYQCIVSEALEEKVGSVTDSG